ncbi:hypothetical protein OAV24_02510 [Gammaproteobacteria bacterium]|nr:hypothetical protein [Gammaproteobacteria bacterium]
MKIWLIKLVIIVAVVAGGVLVTMELGRSWYKNVSPYERCVALKDGYARLAYGELNSETCKSYSGRDYAACINGRLREPCKKVTHW